MREYTILPQQISTIFKANDKRLKTKAAAGQRGWTQFVSVLGAEPVEGIGAALWFAFDFL